MIYEFFVLMMVKVKLTPSPLLFRADSRSCCEKFMSLTSQQVYELTSEIALNSNCVAFVVDSSVHAVNYIHPLVQRSPRNSVPFDNSSFRNLFFYRSAIGQKRTNVALHTGRPKLRFNVNTGARRKEPLALLVTSLLTAGLVGFS